MADITRTDLEQMALKAAPADVYYELADNLDCTSDQELWQLIYANETLSELLDKHLTATEKQRTKGMEPLEALSTLEETDPERVARLWTVITVEWQAPEEP